VEILMKRILKQTANAVSLLLVVPCVLALRLAGVCCGRERAFPGWSQAFGLVPGLAGVYLRRAFYRQVFRECGSDAWITFGTVFSHATARIGKKVYVGAYCCLGDVTLGDDVLVGSHVSIMNGSRQHGIDRLDIPIRDQPGVWPHVTIGRDTWIGDRVVIMADVGQGCVIGSGSVVTAPLPDYVIAVGVPARIVRRRDGTPTAPALAAESCHSRNSREDASVSAPAKESD
jgi:acetyltransferase-like isoleucine patch superfamily enzyme